MMLAVIIGAMMLAGANCIECDKDWVDIGGVCFRFYHDHNRPWTEALDVCHEQDSELAMVVDSNVHQGFVDYITTNELSGTFWLGASDLDSEGDWVWVADGSKVEFGTPFWAIHKDGLGWAHEPNGGGFENCLALDKDRVYYFNDDYCDEIHHPICMK